jgi:hypothetical protein
MDSWRSLTPSSQKKKKYHNIIILSNENPHEKQAFGWQFSIRTNGRDYRRSARAKARAPPFKTSFIGRAVRSGCVMYQ